MVDCGANAAHQSSQCRDTAWMLAAEKGHVDCLRILVEGTGNYAQNDVRTMMSLFSNIRSCVGSLLIIFRWRLSHYMNISNILLKYTLGGWSDPPNMQSGNKMLIYSAGNGHTDCVRMLVAGGADKNAALDVRCARHWLLRCHLRFSANN